VTNSSTRTRYRPIDPIILDLSEPLSAVDRTHEDVVGARCLVVHEGKPIGLVEFPIPTEGVQPDRLADILLARLGGPIGETLSALGRPPDELPLEGLGSNESPAGIDGEVTVVIATRDRTPQLRACLDSILRGIVRPARVIVVDNAPTTSETEDLLRCMSADEPSLHYIREDRPGLAVAHNAALAHIDTTKVLFTDDDVIVHPWWVARMSGALETGSKVACVTGMITPLELRTPTQAAIEQHIGLNKGFERRVFDNGPNRPDDPLFPWAAGTLGSGANMGFRTAFLRDNGDFDEALGAGTVALGGTTSLRSTT